MQRSLVGSEMCIRDRLARCNAFALPKSCMLEMHAKHFGSLEPCCVPAGTVQCICIAKVLHAWSVCTALWLPGAMLRACWHGAKQLHCQSFACFKCMHSTVAPWSRAECLLARCSAVSLPSFARFECTHSIVALSSRAACLLARCNAFALPKLRMLGVRVKHCGSLEPCCVPAGTVQCSCIAKFCML